MIGDQLKAQNTVFYQENAGDWFNLLNKGMVHTGIANSDTHQRRVTSLHTRNVISVPPSLLSNGSANPVAISADPHTVGDSVRAGRTSMSTAPFLRVKAVKNGNSAGLEVSDIFGRRSNPLPTADGAITLSIDVDSPGWAPYDQILVFVNGETLRHTNANTGVATSPPRYKICGPSQTLNLAGAGFVRDEVQVVAGNSAAKKFTTHLEVPVSHPASDYWVVVMVRGTMTEKCPVAGCWFMLRDDTGTIKVDSKSGGFVVVEIPLNTTVTVAGRVSTNGTERFIDATGVHY